MIEGLSTVDAIGFFGPFVMFVVALVVYYIWEGRREERLRERYSEAEER